MHVDGVGEVHFCVVTDVSGGLDRSANWWDGSRLYTDGKDIYLDDTNRDDDYSIRLLLGVASRVPPGGHPRDVETIVVGYGHCESGAMSHARLLSPVFRLHEIIPVYPSGREVGGGRQITRWAIGYEVYDEPEAAGRRAAFLRLYYPLGGPVPRPTDLVVDSMELARIVAMQESARVEDAARVVVVRTFPPPDE